MYLIQRKKAFVLLFVLICFITLVGCSNNKKANNILTCSLNSESDTSQVSMEAVIDYYDDMDEPTTGTFKKAYTGMEKNQTNNDLLVRMIDYQSKLNEIGGIVFDLNVEETAFSSTETWTFADVDIEAAKVIDETQEMFLDNGKYSVSKFKAYYEKQGFQCLTSEK